MTKKSSIIKNKSHNELLIKYNISIAVHNIQMMFETIC